MVVYSYLAAGVPVAFCRDYHRLSDDLNAIKPSLLTTVPRLLEKVRQRIVNKTDQSAALRRGVARWALNRSADSSSWLGGIADRLVYKPVRDALGGNLRCLIVGGAALDPKLEQFYQLLGIPLYAGYGLSEAGPVVSVNTPVAHRLASVGHAFPQVEIKLGEGDEILVRSPGLMRGYWRHDGPAIIDDQGYLHTGDRGQIDEDGFLFIVGRLKEQLKTAGGKYVNPAPIEAQLRQHELIDHALIVAEGRPYTTALIFIDQESWLRRCHQLGLHDLTDLGEQHPLYLELEQFIAALNKGLDKVQRIKRFALSDFELSIADGHLTPTHKLRRKVVEQSCAEQISPLYQVEDES